MDDDITMTFVVFCASMIVIFILANSYVSSTKVEEPKDYPHVEVLLNNDLTNKQVMSTPISVPGVLTGSPSFICYVYNPKEYSQNITVNWWLSHNLPTTYVSMSGYNGSFIINPGNVTELVLSWSLSNDTPKSVVEELDSYGSRVINLDIVPELVE